MSDIKHTKLKEQDEQIFEKVQNVEQKQPAHTVRAMQDTKMPGALLWLSALPTL